MLVPNAMVQVVPQTPLSFWHDVGRALFHVYLILYACTANVPRPVLMRVAGDQADLYNGGRPSITDAGCPVKCTVSEIG